LEAEMIADEIYRDADAEAEKIKADAYEAAEEEARAIRKYAEELRWDANPNLNPHSS